MPRPIAVRRWRRARGRNPASSSDSNCISPEWGAFSHAHKGSVRPSGVLLMALPPPSICSLTASPSWSQHHHCTSGLDLKPWNEAFLITLFLSFLGYSVGPTFKIYSDHNHFSPSLLCHPDRSRSILSWAKWTLFPPLLP